MKVAIYLRVSGRQQDEESQLADCRNLCTLRGWQALPPFREQVSAVKRRPVWEHVKALAHRGEVQAVCIWSLDRMGRDILGILHDVRTIRATGAILTSTRETWLGQSLGGGVDDLLLAVLAWAAEFERKRMLERLHAAQEKIRTDLSARGYYVTRAGKTIRRLGPPNALSPEQCEHLRCMRESLPPGGKLNVSALARLYGVARATVRSYLAKSPNAKGT
jgi:DNA invertase Pin-like site-specific DNA recombinase